jgi:hypothetical protein
LICILERVFHEDQFGNGPRGILFTGKASIGIRIAVQVSCNKIPNKRQRTASEKYLGRWMDGIYLTIRSRRFGIKVYI